MRPTPAALEALALRLIARPSVNGSADEVGFGPFLAETLLAATSGLPVEVWEEETAGDRLGRSTVFARLRGRHTGRAVLLVGHYDVVGTEDYGPLAELAFQPDRLARAFAHHPDPWVRAAAASGSHLFGRGALDMKSGLAAGAGALLHLAGSGSLPDGDVVLACLPDEEADGLGARSLRQRLPHLAERLGVGWWGAVNLDATAPRHPADRHHVIYRGSVGKLLPAVFVGGVSRHASDPFAPMEPGFFLAAAVQAISGQLELADPGAPGADQPGPPPVLLHLGDSRHGYDVQTLGYAYAYFNLVHARRAGTELWAGLRAKLEAAMASAARELARRLGTAAPVSSVRTYTELLAEAPPGWRPPRGAGDVREQALAAVVSLWQHLRLAEPAAILFLAQDPIPRVLARDPGLLAAVAGALEALGLQEDVRVEAAFPGISDMSFLMPALDPAEYETLRGEYPLAAVTEGLTRQALPDLVNIGPSGHDAHGPTERVERHWTFHVLPQLLAEVVRRLLRQDVVPGLPR